MSIGISVTVPDGVVLVADGRDHRMFGSGPQITDGVDKLQPINDRVFAVPFGVTSASSSAIRMLQRVWGVTQVPERIGRIVHRATRKGWRRFVSQLDPHIDRRDPRLGVGLLVAGIAGEPFICEAICSEHTDIAPSVGTGAWVTAVRGGEDQQARERFEEATKAIIDSVGWEGDEGPHNAMTQALMGAAADVIDQAAKESQWIGWPIRGVVVRRGFPTLKEIVRCKR